MTQPDMRETVERQLEQLLEGVTLVGKGPAYGTAEELPFNYDLSSYDDAIEWEDRHSCKHTPEFIMEFNEKEVATCPRCLRTAKRDGEVIRWAGPNEQV